MREYAIEYERADYPYPMTTFATEAELDDLLRMLEQSDGYELIEYYEI